MSHQKPLLTGYSLAVQRNLVSLLAGLLFAAGMVLAPCCGATDTDAQAAQQLIKSTSDSMLSALEREGDALRGNRKRVEELVEEHLLPHIAFQQMSRLVLGKNWRTTTPQQRSDFIQEFRRFLIRFYTASLLEYTKDHAIPTNVMRFLPLRVNVKQNRVTVRSEVNQPGSTQSVPVNYRLYKTKDNQWMVYDVVVDGVSLIANYRSSFSNEIRRGGMNGLIARLTKRNLELDNR